MLKVTVYDRFGKKIAKFKCDSIEDTIDGDRGSVEFWASHYDLVARFHAGAISGYVVQEDRSKGR